MSGRILKRYFLMNKRFLKNGSMCFLFCLVPFLVIGMRVLSQEESGIVHIAIYLENEADSLAAGIVEELMGEAGVLAYTRCGTRQEAVAMVEDYEADAAWIFSSNLQKELQDAAEKGSRSVVTVIEREDNVALMFTRELLCKKLYPYFSYAVYQDFVRDDMGLDKVSDEELERAYRATLVEGSLFQREYLDGEKSDTEEDQSYLLMPMRGILGTWFVLCGFAASMYFLQDERKGVMAKIPLKGRLWAAFGIHAVLLSDAAVILILACRLAGVSVSWKREIVSAILFVGSTLVFCNLVRLLCHIPEILGACIPVLILGMLVLCPVFVNLVKFGTVAHLFPLYYYLKSIYSWYYCYELAIYMLVLLVLCVFVFWWQNRDRY